MATYAEEVADEVLDYLENQELADGEHLWSNLEDVNKILTRLEAIHARISWMEIQGIADPELKKVRTMIVDKAIETFTELARFESRKISGKQIEWDMAKNSRLT